MGHIMETAQKRMLDLGVREDDLKTLNLVERRTCQMLEKRPSTGQVEWRSLLTETWLLLILRGVLMASSVGSGTALDMSQRLIADEVLL